MLLEKGEQSKGHGPPAVDAEGQEYLLEDFKQKTNII